MNIHLPYNKNWDEYVYHYVYQRICVWEMWHHSVKKKHHTFKCLTFTVADCRVSNSYITHFSSAALCFMALSNVQVVYTSDVTCLMLQIYAHVPTLAFKVRHII